MAAESHMEHERPRFYSKEEQENIQFYKDWVRDALMDGIAGVDVLLNYRHRIELSKEDENTLRHKGVDIEPFLAAQRELDAHIDAEMLDAVRDLQRNVFDAGLFHVGVTFEGETVEIDGVTADGTVLIPLVNGEPYDGPFDDVCFDR